MALSAAEVSAIIVKLQNALGSGRASIEYDGRRTTYHTPDEILKAITYFQSVAASLASSAPPSQSYIATTRD